VEVARQHLSSLYSKPLRDNYTRQQG